MISKYENLKPNEIFGKYKDTKTPKWALATSKIIWPFYKEKEYSKIEVERERFIYARMLK